MFFKIMMDEEYDGFTQKPNNQVIWGVHIINRFLHILKKDNYRSEHD